MSEPIDVLLENQALKKQFEMLGLDLSQVFLPVPDDLARENRVLLDLMDWAQQYNECGDRKKMESMGYDFPPIGIGFGPDNDWFIFEQWMKGKTVRGKVRERLPDRFRPKPSKELTDAQIEPELNKLSRHLARMNISVCFNEGVPPRLAYEALLEDLEEEVETIQYGTFVFDGCTGYCPGCFQRPWCETGTSSCWSEDEEAGEMAVIDSVKRYVCPSPGSLQMLKEADGG